MWYASETALQYQEGPDTLLVSAFSPDWSGFSGEIITFPLDSQACLGYDDWVQHFPRAREYELVSGIISSLSEHPRRVHIAGISCARSMEILRDYYRTCGYEDALAKNYTLPSDVLLTVSLSLRHLLWCEKDKDFLRKKDAQGQPYYALVPPLRSPRDLRCLQQAARMGMVMGIEMAAGDETFLPLILEKQILTPFQMSQMLFFRWKKYGFSGTKREITLPLPSFTPDVEQTGE